MNIGRWENIKIKERIIVYCNTCWSQHTEQPETLQNFCLYDDKRVLGKNLKENNWKKYIDGETYAKVKGGMHSKRQESAYFKK